MWCIFCKENNRPSEEHIIPRSVGGSVVTYQVCKYCNSILGSDVDSELIAHAHIYEAYKQLDPVQNPQIRFVFRDSTFEGAKGIEIKVSSDSLSTKIRTTKVSETEFIVDTSDEKFALDYIKKKGKQKGFADDFIAKQINDYSQWSKSKQVGDSYINEAFELRIDACADVGVRKTLMSGTTPHRFLAKACVEFACLFGLQDEILNIDVLRKHARYGTELSSIRCYEEPVWDKSIPYHIIAFNNNQFQIHFFGQYGFAIEICWQLNALNLFLANDIIHKVLLDCKLEANEFLFTNQMIEFKWDHFLKS